VLVVLSLGALWIRVEYVQRSDLGFPIRADAAEYTNYGNNLQQKGIFTRQDPRSEVLVPDDFRSPGLPVLLAASFELEERKLVGRWYDAIRGILVGLGVLTVPLAFLLARRLVPRWAAVAVAGLVAFSPHLVAMSGYVLTETPFAFALTLAMWLLLAAWDSDRPLLWAGSGLSFGLAYLVNETAFFVPLLAFGFLLWWRRRRHGALGGAARPGGLALFLAVFLIAPVGWTIRSRMNVPPAPGAPSRALATITHGSYPDFTYKSRKWKYYPYREDPEQPAYSQSLSGFWRVFSRRVSERPLRYASWYLLEKPYWLWTWNMLQGEGDVYVYPRGEGGSLYDQSSVAGATHGAMRLLHPVLCLLALAAPVLLLLETRRHGRLPGGRTAILVVVGVLAGYTALYAVFAPWPRYAIPLRPLLYTAAAWSVVAGLRLLRTSSPENAG
jgi:4-amino-4-deoxy-L-arabinose transferase-like glycosyltransferase